MEQGGETETSGVELRTLSTISTFSTPRHMISEHASTVISNMAASVITRPNLKFLLHKNKRTAETGLYVSNRKTVIRRGRIVDLGERSYCFGSVKQKNVIIVKQFAEERLKQISVVQPRLLDGYHFIPDHRAGRYNGNKN